MDPTITVSRPARPGQSDGLEPQTQRPPDRKIVPQPPSCWSCWTMPFCQVLRFSLFFFGFPGICAPVLILAPVHSHETTQLRKGLRSSFKGQLFWNLAFLMWLHLPYGRRSAVKSCLANSGEARTKEATVPGGGAPIQCKYTTRWRCKGESRNNSA